MRIRWRGLELPSQVTCETESLTGTYGKFFAEPFERGFGVTVGNSLRRIMLSSLEGAAVTRIKLHGVQHEFTTLPGVVEDVTDIVLNVKSLVVKSHTEQPHVLRIEKNTRGVVTGADVQTDDQTEVINRDHVARDVDRRRPLHGRNGRRERPRIRPRDGVQPAGAGNRDDPLDSAFSPVVRVRYDVEETRVGQKTNYDKLTLEISTNGSLSPEMAAGRSRQDPPQSTSTPSSSTPSSGQQGPRRGPRPSATAGSDPGRSKVQALHEPRRTEPLGPRFSNCLESEEHQHRSRPRRPAPRTSSSKSGTSAKPR